MIRPEVQRFESVGGARIYRLPLEEFPGFWGYAHLLLADGLCALVDCGSGLDLSNEGLERGLEIVRRDHGEPVGWERLTNVLITHGHIDHFGGLSYVRERTRAPIGVHELDQRVLTRYEERVRLITHRLAAFLIEAGVPAAEQARVLELYRVHKALSRSVPVDLTYEAQDMRVGPVRMTHVPGHCPGQVVMQVDDLLLAGDHILSDISPHQAPESLSDNTGLGHYLESLQRLKPLASGVSWTLGGHQSPVRDLAARIAAIEELHRQRLSAVLDILREPRTVAEVSAILFPDVRGYNTLLALEETGAHVEYLAQRARIGLANAEAIGGGEPVPLRYVSIEGAAPS